jgi:hypothetical protein
MSVIYCYMSVIYTVISHLQYTSKITIKKLKKMQPWRTKIEVQWRTRQWRTGAHATATIHTQGVQACTPRVGELAMAYNLYATGRPVPVASYPWRTEIRHQ